MAVPRVYEKFEQTINYNIQSEWSKTAKDVLKWALSVGYQNTLR